MHHLRFMPANGGRLFLTTTLAMLALGGRAAAQESQVVHPHVAAVSGRPLPAKPWQAQSTVSGGLSTGTAGAGNLSLGPTVTRTTSLSTLTFTGNTTINYTAEQTSSDGTQTPSVTYASYKADVRWRRQKHTDARIFWIVHGSATRNTDEGVLGRVFLSTGPGYTLLRSTKQVLTADLRGAFVGEHVLGPDTRIAAFATSLAYQRTVSSASQYTGSVELVQNFKDGYDYQIDSQHTLTAPVSKHIGLTVSLTATYDHKTPPVFIEQDQVTMVARGLSTNLSAGLTIQF